MRMPSIRRTLRALAPAAFALTFALTAAAQPDIAHLAPKRSFLAVTIPDFSRLRSAFEKSELGALWAEPGVKALVEEMTREETKNFGEFLKETGIKMEDLKLPTGQVGLAMFLPDPAEQPAAEGGRRRPSPPPELLAIADMGENADSLQDAIDRLIDRGVKDKQITTEEDTYAGAKITRIKPVIDESKKPKEQPGADDPNRDEGGDEGDPSAIDTVVSGPFGERTQINLARSRSSFLLCTDLKALEAALDAIDGKAGQTLADADELRDTLAQHPDGALAQGVLFTAPLLKLLAQDMSMGAPEGERDTFPKVFDALGLGAVKSLSMSLKLDSPDGVVDLSSAVLVPEKKGLVALLTPAQGPFQPPAFVPPDAADVMRISFRFDGVYDVLRSVAAAMPEQTRPMFNAYLEQGVNIVKPALDTAGPVVHTFTTYKQPLAEDSEQSTVAIDLRDAGVVSSTLSLLAAQGFETRDFEGNTIYSNPEAPFAIGVGFNRLFVGPEPAVENSMRLAGRADAPGISAEPGFKEAARLLADDAVVAQYTDIRQMVRSMYWNWQNQRKLIEEAPIPERRKADMLTALDWVQKLPPIDTLLPHLGNFASDLRSTPDGFRGRTVMLKPSADAK